MDEEWGGGTANGRCVTDGDGESKGRPVATQLPTRGWKGGAGRARVGAAAAAAAEDDGRLREVEGPARIGVTGRVVVKARREER